VVVFDADQLPSVGDTQTVASFEPGQTLRIRGTSKGKGFEGTVTRHHFSRGPETHGSDQHRQPGAIGSGFPQRVFAGMRMAGHMGHQRVTVRTARVQAIHPDQHLLVVTGPVPGPVKGLVTVETLDEQQ
jgi:large subunit ribosomal protein L3